MSGILIGAILGLILGAIGFVALRKLATRVELEETKMALRVAAIADLVLFPVLGAFVGGLTMGE